MSEDYNAYREQLRNLFNAPSAPAHLPVNKQLAEFTPPAAGSASTGASRERSADDTRNFYGAHIPLVRAILYLHEQNEDKALDKNKRGTRNCDRKLVQCLYNLYMAQSYLTRKQLALAVEPEYHWESIVDPITGESINFRTEPTGRTRIQRYAKQLKEAGVISADTDLAL